MVYTPYTYLLAWTEHNKSYYGVRHAVKAQCIYESGCHPDELWVTYKTSSNHVSAMVEKYGEPDVVEVRKTFTTAESAQAWEHKVLRRMHVINKDEWLNRTDNKSICMSLEERQSVYKNKKESGWVDPKKGREFSEEHKLNLSKAATGRKLKPEVRAAFIKKGIESRIARFTLTATLPDGTEDIRVFDSDTPQQDFIDELGVAGSRLARLKKGEEWTIKKLDNNTRHPWPKLTKVKVQLHD